MPGSVRPVGDERDGLLAYLAQRRDAAKLASFGLTDEQARATPTVSPLSVGWLNNHCARTETNWVDTILQRPGGHPAAYAEGFVLRPDEKPAWVIEAYDDVAARTDVVREHVDDATAFPLIAAAEA